MISDVVITFCGHFLDSSYNLMNKYCYYIMLYIKMKIYILLKSISRFVNEFTNLLTS